MTESGQDLQIEMAEIKNLLNTALSESKKRGRALAEGEKIYRMELAKKMLIERDKGTPVTIISDVCRGDENISQLRFERDILESDYRSALEAINVYKLEIKSLENQIQREWGNAE